MKTREYPGVSVDISQLLNELHTFFLHKGYEAQNVHQGSTVAVQARKDVKMIKWAGFSYALTVTITVDDAGTHVTMGGQKWIDKAAIGGAAALLSGGALAVIPAFAAYKQLEIAEEAWHVITTHIQSAAAKVLDAGPSRIWTSSESADEPKVSLAPEAVQRTIALEAAALRADRGWEPSERESQRGRTRLLAALDHPHNLPLRDFIRLAGKSPQQVDEDIEARRLLALSVGRGERKLPDWQLDSVKQQLTETVLRRAADVDNWTLYRVLSEPLEGLAGRSPVNAVTTDSIEDVANAVFNVLGVH
jgi:hypothetical protein